LINPISIVREAFRSLWQAKLITLVSTVTVGITLFFLTILSLAIINVEQWVDKKAGGSAVTLYLQPFLTADEEQTLFNDILAISPSSDSLMFISREVAFDNFAELYGRDILEAVDENPFPAAIEIHPTQNDGDLSTKVEKFSQFGGVESVVYSREWFEKLSKFREKFRIYAWTISIIILLALFFTIANTIKLTVYAREELVVNMQYVGAARWHIRAPFVVEGVLQGIIGAILAYVTVSTVHIILGDAHLFWGDGHLLKVLLLSGATLGWLGSETAVRRFIK
jgi:cell division transport system permease protein